MQGFPRQVVQYHVVPVDLLLPGPRSCYYPVFRRWVSAGSFIAGQSPQYLSTVPASQSPQFPTRKGDFRVKSGNLYKGSLRVAIMGGLLYTLFLGVIGGIYSP